MMLRALRYCLSRSLCLFDILFTRRQYRAIEDGHCCRRLSRYAHMPIMMPRVTPDEEHARALTLFALSACYVCRDKSVIYAACFTPFV